MVLFSPTWCCIFLICSMLLSSTAMHVIRVFEKVKSTSPSILDSYLSAGGAVAMYFDGLV